MSSFPAFPVPAIPIKSRPQRSSAASEALSALPGMSCGKGALNGSSRTAYTALSSSESGRSITDGAGAGASSRADSSTSARTSSRARNSSRARTSARAASVDRTRTRSAPPRSTNRNGRPSSSSSPAASTTLSPSQPEAAYNRRFSSSSTTTTQPEAGAVHMRRFIKRSSSPQREQLGRGGVMRYAHTGERPLSMQLAWLSPEERSCFDSIKSRWEQRYRHYRRTYLFGDEMYMRFARYHRFNEEAAYAAMEKFDPRYMDLTAARLEAQLRTKTLFIAPGLRTAAGGGMDVLYMKPARYFPKKTPHKVIVDNLAYCMLSMTEKESAATKGIAFLANMDGFRMCNFSIPYWLDFMKMLQGNRVPVRVGLVLIVNAPRWFAVLWSRMQSLLGEDFQKVVHTVPEALLPQYLEFGYEDHLPDEMKSGFANTDRMVGDFIEFRNQVERELQKSTQYDETRRKRQEMRRHDEEDDDEYYGVSGPTRRSALTSREVVVRGIIRVKASESCGGGGCGGGNGDRTGAGDGREGEGTGAARGEAMRLRRRRSSLLVFVPNLGS